MSQIETQPSGAIPIAPVDKSGISLRQHTDIGNSQMTLVDDTSQSVEAADREKGTLPPGNPAPEDESPIYELAPEEGPHLPEPVQEAKITRIPAEEWRRVKNGLKIDRAQSTLLVSSKSSFKTDLRKRRKLGTAQKSGTGDNKTTGADQATNKSAQLDVPYRLAINSTYLLKALGQWIGPELSETRNVLVRPFKYLVFYEQEIRQFCSDLELIYDQAEEEAAADGKAGDEMPTGDPVSGQDTKRDAADRAKRERDEFRCVIEFMDRDMADIFDIKRQVTDKTLTEIAFEHLWQLFRPKNIVYIFKTPDDAHRCQAYQILHVAGGRVCFDTGKKCNFNAVSDRNWESASETEERCRNIIKSTDHEITSFLIDCFYLDSDGRRVGPRPKRFIVQRYNGMRPIKLLPLYPAFLHPNHQHIQETLLARGRLFPELAMVSHRRYDGPTFREANQTSRAYHNFVINQAEVHGEIIVDQAKGVEHFIKGRFKWDLRLGGGILFIPTEADARETFDPLPEKQDNGWVTDVVNDSKFELDRRAEFLQSTEILNFQNHDEQGFSDESLLLLPPRLYGYSLVDHKWFALDINHISDIPPRSTTARFEDLVLPKGHGILLQALIKNHVREPRGSSSADEVTGPVSLDVVADKGKGLIILLHGVPGVGKTSTAECVAAELKRPLLPITCGDIGTTASAAESTLESFCTLAHAWRCVLLLDEADVFLTKRETGNIVRNSLVSVFLRVLEYYSGVIILTTNRVGEFDEAFRSRIHISLYYPKLDRESTTEIWEKNIARVNNSGIDIDIEEEKIRRFIHKHWEMNMNMPSRRWNGRQIKNAFQTAIALARWDFYDSDRNKNLKRPLLKATHFNRVAQTSAHFDDYIRDIHGFREDEDSYGILANREAAREDKNTGPVPDTPSTPIRRQTMRPGTGGQGSARGQASHSFQDLDNSDDDEDVEQLELKLKLAKLKKKKKEKGVARTEVVEDMSEDEDEAW
ncbi:hypothetical protein V8F06_002480 [Rhypophila decipiens]